MKTREAAVKFITNQLDYDYQCGREKAGAVHYGLQDLRELMDFIYGGPPQTSAEELTKPDDE
jgi:hypothetical protein